MTYSISKAESKRYDALKVLMCLFVLLIHAYSDNFVDMELGGWRVACQLTFVISRVICDCAVPVFILISSVLLYAKPICFLTNVKKKCRSLLVPYLIFNTLWVAFMVVKHILLASEGELVFASYSLLDWLDAYLGLRGEHKPLLTTLWYVRDLFLLNLLAIPIKKLVDWQPVPVLVATVVLWLCPWRIPGLQAYSPCFFIWGYYLVKYQIHFEDLDRKIGKYWICVAFVVLAVAVTVLQRSFEPLNRLYVLVAAVFWVRCSGVLTRFDRAVRTILPATFFIYLTHRFIYAMIQIVVGESVTMYLLTYPVKLLVALGVLLGCFYLLRRFMPGLLAVLVGGRVKKKSGEEVRQ